MRRPRRRTLFGRLNCLLVLWVWVWPAQARPTSELMGFNGRRAFEDVKRLVAFGPRPSGSKTLALARDWIAHQLQTSGWNVERDSFQAATPNGPIEMTNLIAKLPGRWPQVVILAGHYDTKRFKDFPFVGANDGGSSAAFLLEMARVLPRQKHNLTHWLVFFDGEEAVRAWSATDGLYGSRHLVAKLTSTGELARLRAMILVDMIADADFRIKRDLNSTSELMDLVFRVARQLGYAKHFSPAEMAIEDDHVPFVNAGVPAVNLIDFDYGPNRTYWHTAKDTLDHCSPLGLSIVGRVVAATLQELEKLPLVR